MKREFLRYFPKKSCYPNQLEAMEAIHQALGKKQIVLFEGACGTGKTLSALVPALHVAKQEKKTVVIATNVHQQMAQFIEEAREIHKQNMLKTIVLKGKMLMCPKPNMDYDSCSLLRDNTYKLMEREKDLVQLKNEIRSVNDKSKRVKDPGLIELRRELDRERDGMERQIHEMKKSSCVQLQETLRTDDDAFRSWLFSDVRTPEEVADRALSCGTCGYELLKRFMKEADLLICNYHHFLNEDIRNNVLGWMDKTQQDIIAIFDEAHNIESAARSHSSMVLSELAMNRALDEVEANKDALPSPDAEALLRVLLDTLRHTYNARFKFGERERVGSDWYDLRIADPEERIDRFMTDLLKAWNKEGIKNPQETIEHLRSFGVTIDEFYNRQFLDGKSPMKKISNSLMAASFLSTYLKSQNNRGLFPILSVRRHNNEIYGRIELFTCIPRDVTGPFLNSVHSAVLMSATLQPFDTIKTTLGITRTTCELAFGYTFPREKRHTIAVSVPPLFARNRDSPQTTGVITRVLNDIIEQTDGNVLIFFPSFYEAASYKKRIACNVPVFLDEIGVSAQAVRDEFFRLGESGKKAVLISYMWGTLTEGVDYRDTRGRTVVIVGVGYPALNDRMRAIEHAYEAEFGHGWDYAIEIPTIRKVRQALGRVVRSPDDYGVRVLLDDRYTSVSAKRLGKYSVFNIFPEEERSEIIDVTPEHVKYSLMNFFNDRRKNNDKNKKG